MSTLTLDEFRGKIDDSRAKCAICGHRAHSLTRHLKEEHQLSAGQYKSQYPDALLVSPVATQMLRDMGRTSKGSNDLSQFVEPFNPDTSEEIVGEIKKRLKHGTTNPAILIPKQLKEFYFDPRLIPQVMWGLEHGKNIYIEGPTGCGKTEGVTQLHAYAGKAMKRVNMNGDTTVANFLGKREVDPQKGTHFVEGSLPLAMKGGYTLVLDEIDYMPPSIGAVLNPVLEGNRTLYIPETDETIVAAKGFNIVATANTGGKGDTHGVYTGTEVMNTALLDRFTVKATAHYLPQKEEVHMLAKRFPSTEEKVLEQLTKVAGQVRNAFMEGSLPFSFSTRKLIDLLEMTNGMEFKVAVEAAFLNWMDSDNRATVEKMFESVGIRIK